jgi:molybdopterin/thiamine biosynthesis adenylyltransferase
MFGTVPKDVGRSKADVVATHLRRIAPSALVQAENISVVRQPAVRVLRDRDLVFACTDNHWSRAVLNRFAHQYLIPTVDMGTRLDARQGSVTAAAGRVSLLGPGFSCLVCSGLIDPSRVRAEAMSEAERHRLAKEGYVLGQEGDAPAVISINTTVAALAVTTAVSLFVNVTGDLPGTSVRYDATTCTTFTAGERHEPRCEHCAPLEGVKGLGDGQVVSAYE